MKNITDEQYTRWLETSDAKRLLLMEIVVLPPDTDIPQVLHLGNGFFTTEPDHGDIESYPTIDGASPPQASKQYIDVIVGNPYIEVSVSLEGGYNASVGDIEIDNSTGEFDEWITFALDGRQFAMRLGSPDWEIEDFRPVLVGFVQKLEIEKGNSLTLIVQNNDLLLDTLYTDEIVNPPNEDEETGVIFYDWDQVGVESPTLFGYCRNITPVLIDEATRRYKVSSGVIYDIHNVYVNGYQITNFTKYLEVGEFSIDSEPLTGQITCNATGAATQIIDDDTGVVIDDGIVNTPALVVDHLIAKLNAKHNDEFGYNPSPDTPNYYIGVYYNKHVSYRTILQDLIPFGWSFGFDNNQVFQTTYLTAEVGSVPDYELSPLTTHGDIQMERVALPSWSESIGYYKNYTQLPTPDDRITSASTKNFYKSDFRIAVVENHDTRARYILSERSALRETPIRVLADAEAEAERILAITSKRVSLFQVNTFAELSNAKLGQVIKLYDKRFGLQDGVNFTIVGLRTYPSTTMVEVSLFRVD